METYEPTDWDVVSTRPCPDCRHQISPGFQHGRMPQRPGASHVVCVLQRVYALRKFGPCEREVMGHVAQQILDRAEAGE